MLESPDDCVLIGYFQSPLYFADISTDIRNDLTACFAANVPIEVDLVKMVSSPTSIAVHVRRTDYLTQPLFQVCGREYYRQAIQKMRTDVPNAKFYVFSDDPDWCRVEFNDDDQIVIDTRAISSNPLHDLRLMSLASHHVIANSSYSWWAAWLGEKDGQKVIMPDRWFSGEIHAPIEEKNPGGWTVLRSETS